MPDAAPTARPSRLHWLLRHLLRPVVTVLALLYLLIDALAYWLVKPLAERIGRLKLYARFAVWVGGLGRYPTLALFLVPLLILEPAKPVGGWLIATGRPVAGVAVLGIAELLKMTLVERLFHLTRDRLLTIPAFAWVYARAVAVLDRIRRLAVWQAALGAVRAVRGQVGRLAQQVRGWVRELV